MVRTFWFAQDFPGLALKFSHPKLILLQISQDVVLSLFQRKHVPNCAVPHVWFVGEAVSPRAALGRALSAPTSLVCLTDRCQAHGRHLDTWSIWQMLKFCRSHTFTCKSSHSYFQKKKKKISACLLQSLCCPLMGDAQHCWSPRAPYCESPSRNRRASQTLHTLPPVITAEAALALSVTSPVTDSSICHFSTIKRLSEYSLIQYSPCFRIFPLDQELAHYHLQAKSRPVACFSPQRFIGKQPHSFVHVLSVTSLCVLQLSNCDRECVTYEA